MPEGDAIHYAAGRIRPVLEGHVPDELTTPHPRFARDRWPERLAGQAVRSVDAHGKHLFLRFEGGLTIHSHLRMTGSWRVFEGGRRWTRSPRGAWLVWKVEACFEAGIDPWRPAGKVSDEEAVAIVDAARPRMQQSARDGNQTRHRRIYGRAGLPCPRCGGASLIRAQGQWDDNRPTFWCPRCQS